MPYTQLSLKATPGRRYTFVAKSLAAGELTYGTLKVRNATDTGWIISGVSELSDLKDITATVAEINLLDGASYGANDSGGVGFRAVKVPNI